MLLKQSAHSVMYKSLIIFNRMTGIEMAFTYMPSGFYSGLRSDSPGQLGLLTPLCSTERVGSQPASHLANSLSLELDKQSHPRGTHPRAQKTPTQPSDSPAGLSCLHSGLTSIPPWTELSQKGAHGTTPLHWFCCQNLKAHFGRFAAPRLS